MKKLAILLIALSILSCKDDKEKESVNPQNYSFSADKNDQKWTGTTSIQLKTPDSDTLSFFFTANHPNDEVLVISIKFNGPGIYPLNKNQAYYYSTVGGDVISSRYAMGADDSGQLTITKYNTTQKMIEGTFEVSLQKQFANPENNIDVLKFTNGTFKWKLLK